MPEHRNLKKSVGHLLLQTDWALLAFLVAAVHIKLYVKLVGIVFYGCWLFWKKVKLRALPGPVWFYILMPVLGITVAALYGSFSQAGYVLGAAWGAIQWLAGGAVFYLLYLTARQKNLEVLIATSKAFFVLNALVTLGQFSALIVESGHIMPYWFYDSGLKYGASTGDRLTGICLNNSLNNAAISLMGVLFFLLRKNLGYAALCVLVLLMCTSNVVSFGMMLLLLLMLLTGGRKGLRADALKLMLLTAVIYPTLSPQNFLYVRHVLSRLSNENKPFIASELADKDSLLSDSAARMMDFPLRSLSLRVPDSTFRQMPQLLIRLRQTSDTIDKPAWSYLVLEPAAIRPSFEKWYGVPPEHTLLAHYGKPAKAFAIRQTISYLNEHPIHWLAGAGMGNFSSKLAVKMTGLKLQGSFPQKQIYISRPFLENHFYTLMYVFSRDVGEHSVINMPGSTYLQLAGEYGLIGLMLFVALYFGWLWIACRDFKDGRWLLLALLGLFWLDYWFEMMTLTVVIEFILLLGTFASKATDAES
ncbi:MAG: hypothetical protein JST06_08920 [Bacteroidetes bacterium]|nr:hypothetical protein [Bacteroidota bacterium]MBS1630230.1 hypothetical protein [Bacteroidota bacterium]